MSMFYPSGFRFVTVFLLLLIAHCFISPAQAEYHPGGLDFSLQVEHSETRWQYTNIALTSKSSKLGVQLKETLASRLRGTLYAGYLDLSQPDNTLPAAQVTTGYYGGIDLTLLLLKLPWIDLELTGGYGYQDTRGSEGDTTVNFVWYDTYAQLGMSIPVSGQLDLRAASGMINTSGEQRVSGGTGNQLFTFDEQKQRYYTAGLDYWLDGTGYISLRWLGGNSDGFRISFHRGF